MNNKTQRTRGTTFFSTILLVVFLSMLVLVGLKLVPKYFSEVGQLADRMCIESQHRVDTEGALDLTSSDYYQ